MDNSHKRNKWNKWNKQDIQNMQNKESDIEQKIARRQFIIDFARKSVIAVGVLIGGRYFVNKNPFERTKKVKTIPSFRVIKQEDDVFGLSKGADAKKITVSAINAVGGMGKFVSKGDKVLLKVNCAFARPAWMGATSSPEVVGQIIELCYRAGASEVWVTDNPINDAAICFERSGLSKAIKQAGGKLLLPNKDSFSDVKISNGVIGVWKTYYEPIIRCNKLIGVPTLKSHNLCGASLAMKNWYGFMGGSRNRFHQDIHNVIAELGAFITPSLVVLDATRALIRNGPTGGSSSDVIRMNTIAVSTDQVAIDAFGTELLGLNKEKVKYISIAESKGIGVSDYRKLKYFREAKS